MYSQLKGFLTCLGFSEGSMKSVYNSISLVLTILNLEIVLREFIGLADLTKAQIFYIHELTEVVAVCKHEDFILIAFKVGLLVLETCNNYQGLAVIDLILTLSRNHCFSYCNPDFKWQHLVNCLETQLMI